MQLTGQKREGEREGSKDGEAACFRWHWAGTAGRSGGGGAKRCPASIRMTHSTDEARIVPAVAQGLQEPIPGIDLEITAVAFGAKHLLIVCRDKEVTGVEARGPREITVRRTQSE